VGSFAQQQIQGFNSLAVGQAQIDQDRRYASSSWLFPRGQAIQPLSAASDPIDSKRCIARVRQRLLDAFSIR
jgi:hypothetical protein